MVPTLYPLPAPITNLSVKFGVLFDPSHKAHPVGIEDVDPDHIIIPPTGTDTLAPPEGPGGPGFPTGPGGPPEPGEPVDPGGPGGPAGPGGPPAGPGGPGGPPAGPGGPGGP